MRRALTLLLGAGAVLLAPTAQGAPHAISPHVIVSAHRGRSAYAPENTMTAFRNAVRLGADQLETDTQLTSDGHLVLIHDDTLDRTTSCTGTVQSRPLAQLEACDAGWWWTPGQGVTDVAATAPHPLRGTGIRVPEAHELLDYVRSLGAGDTHTISIEIKDQPGEANFDPTGTATAQVLVPLIEASGLKDRTIVQSFWPAALTVVKAMDHSIKTQLLTVFATTPYLAYAIANGDEIIAPDSTQPDFTSTFVAAAHAAGKLVIPYTPDTAADLTATAVTGVDGEITNFPACLLDLEGRARPVQLLPATSLAAGSGPVAACQGGPLTPLPAKAPTPAPSPAAQIPEPLPRPPALAAPGRGLAATGLDRRFAGGALLLSVVGLGLMRRRRCDA